MQSNLKSGTGFLPVYTGDQFSLNSLHYTVNIGQYCSAVSINGHLGPRRGLSIPFSSMKTSFIDTAISRKGENRLRQHIFGVKCMCSQYCLILFADNQSIMGKLSSPGGSFVKSGHSNLLLLGLRALGWEVPRDLKEGKIKVDMHIITTGSIIRGSIQPLYLDFKVALPYAPLLHTQA